MLAPGMRRAGASTVRVDVVRGGLIRRALGTVVYCFNAYLHDVCTARGLCDCPPAREQSCHKDS